MMEGERVDLNEIRDGISKREDSLTYSDTCGMYWSEIAESAYKAYAASTGNKNYQGLPMPEFKDLTPAIQTAWEAAVRQASYCTAFSRSVELDEQRWAGWVRP